MTGAEILRTRALAELDRLYLVRLCLHRARGLVRALTQIAGRGTAPAGSPTGHQPPAPAPAEGEAAGPPGRGPNPH